MEDRTDKIGQEVSVTFSPTDLRDSGALRFTLGLGLAGEALFFDSANKGYESSKESRTEKRTLRSSGISGCFLLLSTYIPSKAATV